MPVNHLVCGLNAQKFHNHLEYGTDSSVDILIRSLVKQGELQSGLSLYVKMNKDSVQPSVYTLVALLKACGALRDSERGCEIHAEIARKGFLQGDLFVGNTLIDMYAKWGWFANAKEVFDRLSAPDVVSWTALMGGYVNYGHSEEVLHCFRHMQYRGASPNALTYVYCLKACGSGGIIEKGLEIHTEIERKGLLETDVVVGNAVIDMYVKFGLLTNAEEVFENLHVRDVVSWTAMIYGYANYDLGMEALYCFEEMQAEGVSPNAHTYVCTLKACGLLQAIEKGRELHEEIGKKGLLKNLVVGSAVVDMYCKCGSIARAEDVLKKLPVQDVASWNALIMAYAKAEQGQEALDCFERMRSKQVIPTAITYVSILRACGAMKASSKGEEIHRLIAKERSLERSPFVGTALVDMYAKCGLLVKAQEVFEVLLVRDVIGWNALIAGYANNNQGEEALIRFKKMQSEAVVPDAATFVCTLGACGSTKALDMGRQLHVDLARMGLVNREPLVGNALVGMYGKCGLLATAEEILGSLTVRDVVSWTTLISGYVLEECGSEALLCFERMQADGISPNEVTFACSLKACGMVADIDKGQEIHATFAKEGLLESNLIVGSALVDMYAKCGLLGKAQEVFDKLIAKDVITWNALIAGYTKYELGKEALHTFDRMKQAGMPPNAVTYIGVLNACGITQDFERGQCIHEDIDRERFLEKEPVVGNALVDMYIKCGSLVKARELFDELTVHDVVAWNTLIGGYATCEHSKLALDCYDNMQEEGVVPDAVTFASVLKACSSIGAIDKGEEIHGQIAREGLLEGDLMIGNAIIDFYVKSGWVAKAQEVFDKLLVRDVISWNALITGYAQSGDDRNVFLMYDRMVEAEKPDLVTFLSVLNACSHGGLSDKAEAYFATMTQDYGLIPTLEHYTCMADLLGRAGHLEAAMAMIEKMAPDPDLVAWHTALDASQKWGNVELGKRAFERAVRLDARDPAAYMRMSNIYAAAGMDEDARKVEAMCMENGALGHVEQNDV